jgi:hypothetical protein
MMKHSILSIWLLCFTIVSNAQNIRFKKDITEIGDSSRVQKIINLLKGTPNPLIDSTNMVINRYIQSIGSLEGKIIRSINIEQRHFGTDVDKPTFQKNNVFISFANQLHDKTNKSTITKNLFIKTNEPLNPLLVAYNEKWLRDLGFIQDARILAYPNKEDTNQVDVFVVTKDIFPIGGYFNLKEANAFEINLNTENVNDLGNAFSISQNYDHERKTKTGWGFDYTTRNIIGSFLDIKTGAKSYTDNYANKMASANKVFISGGKPLLHPLDRWTYGFEIRQEKNRNAYNTWSDSLYKNALQYHLKHFDANIGYQLFIKNRIYQNDNLRYFLQMRYLENDFITRPIQYLDQIDRNYQSIQAYFGSLTLFKQKIIRTQYLYGFGRNEDLPTGKSLMITTGHYNREGQSLPYLGIQLESYTLLKNENFRHAKLNLGSSYIDKQIQDFRFLASLESISKIHYLESGYRYRQILNLSFAQTLKNKFNEALLINSIYGIPQLNKERIKGGTRITANWESIWYNSRTFYGFKKAPFVFANLTYIRTVSEPIKNGDIYSALGAGIRVRNENLILGTIELKGFYFPRTNLQLSPFNISLMANIRFKYNSSLIEKPDFVAIN